MAAVGVLLACSWAAGLWELAFLSGSRLNRVAALVTVTAVGLVALVAARDNFYGFEYEDAYEYIAAARLAIEGAPTGLSNEVCLARATPSRCDVRGATTHPIGYASLITALSPAVRDPADAARIISSLATVSLVIAIVLHAEASGRLRSFTPWVIASAMGPMAPVLLFSTFAEPLATLFLTMAFACFERATRNGRRSTHGLGAACILGAGLVRREHALGAVLFALEVVRRRLVGREHRTSWFDVAPWGVVAVALSAFALSGDADGAFAGHRAFSPLYAVHGAPAFLRSLASADRFASMGLAAVALVIGVFALLVSRIALVLFGAYVILFMCFGQSFWVLAGEAILPLHVDRYLVQLSGVVAIAANALCHEGWRRSSGTWRRLLLSFLIALGLASVGRGLVLRHRWAARERHVRTRPVLAACRVIRPPKVVVSSESLIVEALCPQAASIGFQSLGDPSSSTLSRVLAHAGNLYYLPGLAESAGYRQRWEPSAAFIAGLTWTPARGDVPDAPRTLLHAVP